MMTLLAYIDPGTGSFLLQMLVAGALGAGLAITSIRDRIVYFVKGLFGKKKPQAPAGTTGGDSDKSST